MRTVIFILMISALAAVDRAAGQSISGAVTDETGAPLPSVTVSLPAAHRGTVTDTAGAYTIGGLSHGIYRLEFTLIGHAKEVRTVTLESGAVTLDVTLRQSTLELPGVIVTGKPQPSDALSSPQPISSIDGRELDRSRGQTVMQTLANSPGVSVYTTGAGIAKPVVRGLTSQRVLVINDGLRQEGQQWGDEHGPEVDAFNVERIEVLRGPGSVLYGSDAIGGVVNVVARGLPSRAAGDAALAGRATLNGFSNNDHASGNLFLAGAGGAFGYRASVTARRAGDISTPAGALSNSGMEEFDASASAGASGDWGTLFAGYATFGQELEIHEDPAEEPDATPYQKVDHDRLRLHGDIPLHALRLEMDAGWQRNDRKEFEEADAPREALHLRLTTLSLDARAHHHPVGPAFGTIGLSLTREENETLAEEKLIPGYRMTNVAGYLFEEARLGKTVLSAGARYDSRVIDVERTDELNVAAQERAYDAFTGTVGVVYRFTEEFSLGGNAGSGWRAPSAFELFVDGVHEGTVQYLVGDSTLGTERSLNVDLSAQYSSGTLQAGLTAYRNTIDRFIHQSPTGEVDPGSGFDIYRLTQADALLTGVELSFQAGAAEWLVLSGGLDLVRGENAETGRPLPLMPAGKVRAAARLLLPSGGAVEQPYVSFGVRAAFEQDRVEVYETPTAGYTLFELGAGCEVLFGGTRAAVDLSVENLFDEAYADHLSRYKAYALNMGRNVSLKLSVPFTLAE